MSAGLGMAVGCAVGMTVGTGEAVGSSVGVAVAVGGGANVGVALGSIVAVAKGVSVAETDVSRATKETAIFAAARRVLSPRKSSPGDS